MSWPSSTDYAVFPLPAIFLKTEAGLRPWIGQGEINRCQSLAELKQLVESKPR